MKIKLIFLVFLIAFSNCKRNPIEKRMTNDGTYHAIFRFDSVICCCKYLTQDNSRFWKIDSIGLNGFRRTFVPLLLKECNFNGAKWKNIELFFGNPKSIINNLVIEGSESIIFMYLTYLDSLAPKPMESFKTQFFEIVLSKKDSVVIKTSIRYVDG